MYLWRQESKAKHVFTFETATLPTSGACCVDETGGPAKPWGPLVFGPPCWDYRNAPDLVGFCLLACLVGVVLFFTFYKCSGSELKSSGSCDQYFANYAISPALRDFELETERFLVNHNLFCS